MDFGKAFSYPFEDPDWLKKIGLVALVSLIPILGQIILMGWTLDVVRRVIRQEPLPLANLDFGTNLIDGLKLFVVVLVYLIPVWIFTVPMAILPAAFGDEGGGAEGIIAITITCCSGLIILYSFAIAFFLPAAYGVLAANGNLGSAFRFREVIGLVRTSPGAYLLVLLGTILTGLIGQLGIIACAIGVVFTLAYAMAVNGHLYGQAYNDATRNKGFARAY